MGTIVKPMPAIITRDHLTLVQGVGLLTGIAIDSAPISRACTGVLTLSISARAVHTWIWVTEVTYAMQRKFQHDACFNMHIKNINTFRTTHKHACVHT